MEGEKYGQAIESTRATTAWECLREVQEEGLQPLRQGRESRRDLLQVQNKFLTYKLMIW